MNKNAKLELLMAYYEKHGFKFSWNQIETLHSVARAAQRNAENICNIPDYVDKRASLQNRLSKSFNADVLALITIEGDPRGCVLKLQSRNFDDVLCPEFFN